MSLAGMTHSVDAIPRQLSFDTSFAAPVEVVDWFDRFWKAYPRKVGKPAARKAFARAIKCCDLREMSDGLRRWVIYWAERDDPQFIPHPTTWLNQERWNDEPPPLRSRDEGVAALDRVRRRRAMRGALDALGSG